MSLFHRPRWDVLSSFRICIPHRVSISSILPCCVPGFSFICAEYHEDCISSATTVYDWRHCQNSFMLTWVWKSKWPCYICCWFFDIYLFGLLPWRVEVWKKDTQLLYMVGIGNTILCIDGAISIVLRSTFYWLSVVWMGAWFNTSILF